MDRPRPDPELLRQGTRLSRVISPALCVAIYAAVVALAWAGSHEWRFAPVAVLLIAGLQHHLLILLHESAHVLLHPNRVVNDLLGNLFCAVPLFTLVKNYRIFHLVHHRFSGSPARDPEVPLYAAQGYAYRRRGALGVAGLLLRDLLGWNTMRFLAETKVIADRMKREHKFPGWSPVDGFFVLGVWGPVVAAAVVFDFWRELLVFWVLPQATLVYLFLKLHGYGEHTGATGPTEFERTWVHDFNPVTNFFVYPIASGYHLEHHLFPRVPWYRMKRFRRELMKDAEYARLSERVTLDGYFFGKRTVLRTMLLGAGEYREELAARKDELAGEVVSDDTRVEVVDQLGARGGA
jgi:fatty acid desaturase